MKKLIIGFIIFSVTVMGFMYKRDKDREIEKRKQEDISLIKSSTSMINDVDIEKIAASNKMNQSDQAFYKSIGGKWSDALAVAGSTPRIGLATPIQNLQAIKRELESKKTNTDCEQFLKTNLLYSYEYTIKSFLGFMQDNESSSKEYMNEGMTYMDNSIFLIGYCKADKATK